jgi:hypothetical protein
MSNSQKLKKIHKLQKKIQKFDMCKKMYLNILHNGKNLDENLKNYSKWPQLEGPAGESLLCPKKFDLVGVPFKCKLSPTSSLLLSSLLPPSSLSHPSLSPPSLSLLPPPPLAYR